MWYDLGHTSRTSGYGPGNSPNVMIITTPFCMPTAALLYLSAEVPFNNLFVMWTTCIDMDKFPKRVAYPTLSWVELPPEVIFKEVRKKFIA